MPKFFLVANESRDTGLALTHRLLDYLRKKQCDCEYGLLSGLERIPADADFCLVLGGDGTMLEASHLLPDPGIPLLGVHLGRVGYLTEVEAEQAEQAVDSLLRGAYSREERMMLSGSVTDESGRPLTSDIALNDITIARYGSVRMIRLHVYVNDMPLCSYHADGIILSTPTGSTGYNMAAGGPIVEPTADLIVLTPIAAHMLSARSIILSPGDRVRVALEEGGADAEISFDGAHMVVVKPGAHADIMRADRRTCIARLNPVSFIDVLHQKMK